MNLVGNFLLQGQILGFTAIMKNYHYMTVSIA